MKKGIWSRFLVVVLAVAMIFAFSACGNGGGTAGGSGSAAGDAGSVAGDAGSVAGGEQSAAGIEGPLHIGYNTLGTDWILMQFCERIQQVATIDNPDSQYTETVGNYNANETQSGIQNMLSAGINGLIYCPSFATLTPQVVSDCETTGTAFIGFCNTPSEDQWSIFSDNPMSAGYIGSACFDIGYQLGEQAAKDGHKTALVITGTEGLIDMDLRKDGFTAAFEEAGGKVLAVAHCATPQEVVSKASDMLTANPDAECIYGVTGVSGVGGIAALNNFDLLGKVKIYCTDLEPDMMENVRDGSIAAGDGGRDGQALLAACLLINKLHGHPILKDGKAPVSEDVPSLLITADNVDLYSQLFIDDTPFTEDMIKSLLWTHNPDVSWDDYQAFIDNWDLEYLKAQKGL